MSRALEVRVVDPDGDPVPEVAVFLEQDTASSPDPAASKSAVSGVFSVGFRTMQLFVATDGAILCET